MIPNPFFHRGPIRDRAYFFGREHETGQTLSLLGNGQSVFLVGQRRIGKTSLLFHIAAPEVFARHGLSPDEHLFVYIDCGGLGGLDQPGLYRVLLEEIGDALAEGGSSPNWLEAVDDARPITYRAFERALRGLIRQVGDQRIAPGPGRGGGAVGKRAGRGVHVAGLISL